MGWHLLQYIDGSFMNTGTLSKVVVSEVYIHIIPSWIQLEPLHVGRDWTDSSKEHLVLKSWLTPPTDGQHKWHVYVSLYEHS